MKAVRIHEFGGPEVLRYEDVPDAKPRKDQVLVRVRACAMNHLDLWVRKGLPGVSLPHILGSDVAGEIVEIGEYVTGFRPGQRVLLAPMHFCNHCAQCVAGLQNQCPEFTVLGNRVDGGNCELIAVPAVNVIPLPDSLDFNQAASLPLVFLTAWHMLVGRAGIRPGQTVLVLGAGSGVGIAAIQVAKLFHARVITTAGDEKKLERARGLGADHGINHYQQKISEEVKQLTNQEGVDILGTEHEVPEARRHSGYLRRHDRLQRQLRLTLSVCTPTLAPGFLHGHHGRIVCRAGTCLCWPVEAGGGQHVRSARHPLRARVPGKEPDVWQDRNQSVDGWIPAQAPCYLAPSRVVPP